MEKLSAKQMVKDIEILKKIMQLRVNTWAVLGNDCCMEYHATAGNSTLQALVQASDNLSINASWIPSFQAR